MRNFIAIVVLGFGQIVFGQTVFGQPTQHQTDCYNTYEQMRTNGQTNPAVASPFGRRFLDNGCGDVYPTLVGPVQQYLSAFEQQKAALAVDPGLAPQGKSPAANDPEMRFKLGDYVVVDVFQSMEPARAKFENGTVIEVDHTNRAYTVRLDPVAGATPKVVSIIARPYSQPHWIRLLGGAAPPFVTEKLRTDAVGTVLPDREILDCPNLFLRGTNGSPLPVEQGKQLIRCLHERSAAPRSDGARTVDVTALSVSAPRLWNNDDRAGGNLQTLVYPVFARWTQKSFFRDKNVVFTDVEDSFTCFVDVRDFWQCGLAPGPRSEGKRQEIVVTK